MPYTNTKENGLEALIVKWLVEQNGYEPGTNEDYNREYAIDETRLFRFLEETQPEELAKLGVRKSHQKYIQFLNRLQSEIAKRGIIDVLRNGIKVYPAARLSHSVVHTVSSGQFCHMVMQIGKSFLFSLTCLFQSFLHRATTICHRESWMRLILTATA